MSVKFKPVIPPASGPGLQNSDVNSNSNQVQSYFDPLSPLYRVHMLIKANDIDGLEEYMRENPQIWDIKDSNNHLYPIHYIILHGVEKMVRKLFPLDRQHFNRYDDMGRSLPYYAAITENKYVFHVVSADYDMTHLGEDEFSRNIYNFMAAMGLPKKNFTEMLGAIYSTGYRDLSHVYFGDITPFLEIAVNGYVEDIYHYFKTSDIYCVHQGLSPLDYAMIFGNFRMYNVLKTLSESTNREKKYLRHFNAAVGNNLKLFKDVLEFYACNLHEINDGINVLHYAAKNNADEIIYYLVMDMKMDVNEKGKGYTPLQHAVIEGQANSCKMLLDLCANTEIKSDKGNTALHLAAGSQWLDCVKILLDEGCDIEAKNIDGNTPIALSAKTGKMKTFKMFLNHGADINVLECITGSTLLHWVAYWDSLEFVQLLLDRGLDVNARNKDGDTPLHRALIGANLDVVRCLLSHGANPNAVNNKGSNLIHFAAISKHADVLQYIITRYNLDINKRNNEDLTPIQLATQNDLPDNIKAISQAGGDINVQWNGDSLLIMASRHNALNVFRYLFRVTDGPQNIQNIKDPNGNTPLHIAAMNRDMEFCQYLLDHGFPKDVKNNEGKLPVNYVMYQEDFRRLLA